MEKAEVVTVYSESAFHALGLPDADDLVLRAELLASIAAVVRQRDLTEADVGDLTGMDRESAAAMLNGRVTLFSTEQLLRALNDLGQDIELRITSSPTGKGRMHVTA
jgi:predicted XRE-type DNA-binding protein